MGLHDYTTLADLKMYLGIATADTTNDSRLGVLITATSRAIDAYCRRRFYASTETRCYDWTAFDQRAADTGNLRPRLWLDADLISLTSITRIDTTLTTDDYACFPRIGPPYRWIEFTRIIGNFWLRPLIVTMEPLFTLVGSWGYVTADATALVTQACQAWTGQQFALSQAAGIQSKSLGDFSVSYRSVDENVHVGQDGLKQFLPPQEIAMLLNGLRFRDYRSAIM